MKKSQVASRKTQALGYKLEEERLEGVLKTLYNTEPSEENWQRAKSKLTKSLAEAKRQAILYGKLEHPMIDNLYVATRSNEVITINFGIEEDVFLQQIEKQFNLPTYFAPHETEEVIQQVQAYLDGQRTNFDLPTDISILTAFQQQVLQATQQIPRGRIATYMDIARKIGKPKAVRAVGQALGRNPIPIVIPCHRVIASDGTLGGYSGGGGLETKAKLLQLEGALAI